MNFKVIGRNIIIAVFAVVLVALVVKISLSFEVVSSSIEGIIIESKNILS